MRFASWNVGTMTARGRELADVFKRRRINVACLQETKWKGTKAREIGEGYKFYYSGSDGKRNGVGIVLDKELKECVTQVKRVNDRMIVVKVIVQNVILNIASVYAPQSGCDDRVKEKFWEEFDAMVTNIPDCEEIYIGGDFNGHVGRLNEGYERIHGGWGFGNRNNDGEALLQAALAFDLALANTFFEKRDQHLITYKSGSHTTQIDFFLMRRNKISSIKDCKVIPGENIVPQHRLLVVDVNYVTKVRAGSRPRPEPRIRWRLLEKYEYRIEFKERVIDGMKDVKGNSVNECWNEMATIIRDVAKSVLGESKGKGRVERDTWWWSDDVQMALKDKKKAFKEWQKANDSDVSAKERKKLLYQDLRRKAKKTVAIARAAALGKLYEKLSSPHGQKDLFKIAKQRETKAKDISIIKCIKDDAGKVLMNDEEIKERWKSYFAKLMNEENDWSGSLKTVPVNMGVIREISVNEVKEAIQGMKNGKAIGPDGIPAEVWKCLREDGCKWLTLFFNKLLQEEVIPDEWSSSALVPIFKNKGDVQDCNSYRGIKLMSHSMKIWEKVIERRVREETEIAQNQFGFMPGRGTTDAIFALRQLCEKYKRTHRNLHMVFVDLEKAYDRVPREVLWWALKEKSVPGKYVQLIRAMYNNATTYVRSAAGSTDRFSVAVGLHQGSALSPYLFLLVMDALTLDIQEEAPWCMLFADDIVLVGENGSEVQSRLVKWQQKLENCGLKISRTKTELLFCDFGGLSSFTPVSLDGALIPVCSDFRYLGSLVQSDGNIDRDVKHRIGVGWMKWRQVSGTVCDPQMPLKLKGRIYKAVIRPVVLYGSECWATKRTDERRLHVAEMRMLRWMCGVTRMDRVRNEYVRGSLKVAPIPEKVRSHRLTWYGHVMRRDERHINRRAMDMVVDGYKGRGRPKKTWMECVKEDMDMKGVTVDMTANRECWRRMTYCADPT